MSYDINFWRQERKLDQSPSEIYAQLCQGETVDGLANLPKAAIIDRLRDAFPDEFEEDENELFIDFEDGAIEVSVTDQACRFDLRGVCPGVQKIVDIMNDYECPMYDPQIDKRYDSADGTALGDKPNLSMAGGGRQRGRLADAMLDEIMAGDTSKKKGCAGGTAAVLLALFTIGWLAVRMVA